MKHASDSVCVCVCVCVLWRGGGGGESEKGQDFLLPKRNWKAETCERKRCLAAIITRICRLQPAGHQL